MSRKDRPGTYTLVRPPLELTCVASLPREAARRWLDRQSAALAREGAWPFASRGVIRDPSLEGLETVFLKPHVGAAGRDLLRAIAGRPGRSRRAFGVGLRLAAANVQAARPLALLEERRGGVARRSCLVLQAIEGLTLRDFILSRLPTQAEGEERDRFKRSLWSAVATAVARLHRADVRQRDLKAPNIVIRETDGSRLTAILVDLEGMTLLAAPPSERVRVRDLARLAVSLREEAVAAAGVTGDDLRFLIDGYLRKARGESPPREDIERYLERIVRWARRKERRNRRRGRVTH